MKTAAELKATKTQLRKQRELELRRKALSWLDEQGAALEARLLAEDTVDLVIGDLLSNELGEALCNELRDLGYLASYSQATKALSVSIPDVAVYRDNKVRGHTQKDSPTPDSECDWGRDEIDTSALKGGKNFDKDGMTEMWRNGR